MLLIIQNGYLTPSLPKYLKTKHVIIKSYECNVSELDLDLYDIVIILGGHQSITKIDYYPYLHNVLKLIKHCLNISKPIFAICLGAQLLAYSLGCTIRPDSKINIGYDIDILGYKNIFRYHVDYIIPNDKLIVETKIDDIPYLFYHKKSVGIQCHPDISPECVIKYSNHSASIDYAKKYSDLIDNTNMIIIDKILETLKKN